MKNLTLSSIAVSLLLLAGCAGVTDANLSDINANTTEAQVVNTSDLQAKETARDEGISVRGGHDQEDVVTPKPERDERD